MKSSFIHSENDIISSHFASLGQGITVNVRPRMTQETDDGIADAGKAKIGGIDFINGYPKSLSGIVLSMDGRSVTMYSDKEIHVERMNTHSAILVNVGRGKKILYAVDLQTCLLLNFTSHTFFNGFIHVAETAREVEGAFGRLLGTTYYQQLIVVVDDECCCGRAGIGIIREATVPALLAFEVVDLKMTAATNRTVFEFL
jgi:hypothetical protein